MDADLEIGSESEGQICRVMLQQWARWLGFASRILRNSADAEDVLQEVARKAISSGRQFRTELEARHYLARAINNAALDMYQSRRRERLRSVPALEQSLVDHRQVGPLALLEQRERSDLENQLLRLLGAALQELPDKEQEALRLIKLDQNGCSIRNVGSLYGIPYSTLRYRCLRGIRRLRRILTRSLLSPADGARHSSDNSAG